MSFRIARRQRTGGLGGLGQFNPEDLVARQAELKKVRLERAGLEAKLESLRTGKPIRIAPAAARAALSVQPGSIAAAVGGVPKKYIWVGGALALAALGWVAFGPAGKKR